MDPIERLMAENQKIFSKAVMFLLAAISIGPYTYRFAFYVTSNVFVGVMIALLMTISVYYLMVKVFNKTMAKKE